MKPFSSALQGETLEAEHEALLAFLYLCPAGVVQTGVDGTVRMINPCAAQLLLPISPTHDIDNLFEALGSCAPELRNLTGDFAADQGRVCDGHRIFIGGNAPGPRVLSCSLVKVSADCLVAVLQDISREVAQERQIKQNEALFAALVAGVNDFTLFSLDSRGWINTWNLSGERQTGFLRNEVLGRSLDALCIPDAAWPSGADEQVATAAREGWSLRETRCLRRNGQRYWCQILVAAMEGPTGAITSYSVVMRDVTERRMTSEELRRLLTTDHLTGAANRAHFFERAEVGLTRHVRTGRPISVIMLDVDHFKRVNDDFGHAVGDTLLRRLVQCCRSCLHEQDVLARLGGEEFAVLLPDIDLPGAVSIAEQMRHAVRVGLAALNGFAVGATISLGCAEMNDQLDGFDALLCEADAALYNAKRAGRDQVMSTPGTLTLVNGAAA